MSKYYILNNIIYTNLQKWLRYDDAKLNTEGYLGKPVVAQPEVFQIISNILHFRVVMVISKEEIFIRKKW